LGISKGMLPLENITPKNTLTRQNKEMAPSPQPAGVLRISRFAQKIHHAGQLGVRIGT